MANFSLSIPEILYSLSESEKEELYGELADELGNDSYPSTEDFLDGLSRSEKNSLYHELRAEMGDSDDQMLDSTCKLTPMEQDIRQVLIGIWDKRTLLTPAQRQTLTDVLNASNI